MNAATNALSDAYPPFIQSPSNICEREVAGLSRVRRVDIIKPAFEKARSTSTDVAAKADVQMFRRLDVQTFKRLTWRSENINRHLSQPTHRRLMSPPCQRLTVERCHRDVDLRSVDVGVERILLLVTLTLLRVSGQQHVEVISDLNVDNVERCQSNERCNVCSYIEILTSRATTSLPLFSTTR